MSQLPPAPGRIGPGEQTHTGRFLGAIAEPAITAPGGAWRLKEWNYFSVVTPSHFLAAAVVQLGYVANIFCYLLDRKTGHMIQTECLSPLGRALRIAPAPRQGQSCWSAGGERLSVSATQTGWLVELHARLDGRLLQGQVEIDAEDGLSLVFPLTPEQTAYTHKAAGMPARVALQLDGAPLVGEGLAAWDWTRSAALRRTVWNWASFACRLADGRRVGLNLSAHVYDVEGASQENAIWLDGRLALAPAVQFHVPADPARAPWRVSGAALDLTFSPQGARQQDTNLGLVRSRFIQPFGLFNGHVVAGDGEMLAIRDAFGVVEDHLAIW